MPALHPLLSRPPFNTPPPPRILITNYSLTLSFFLNSEKREFWSVEAKVKVALGENLSLYVAHWACKVRRFWRVEQRCASRTLRSSSQLSTEPPCPRSFQGVTLCYLLTDQRDPFTTVYYKTPSYIVYYSSLSFKSNYFARSIVVVGYSVEARRIIQVKCFHCTNDICPGEPV